MKTKMKIAGLLLVLIAAGSLAVNAQNGRNRAYDAGQVCSSLPGITDQQKTQLTSLAEKHRTEMDALRAEMRSAPDRDSRSASWTKMDNLRTSHRNEVLALLNDEQKAAFNANCPYYGSGRAAMGSGNRGNGGGRGNGNGRGRGNL